jgi:hypothetical protein
MMHRHDGAQSGSIGAQLVYSIARLAKLGGVSRFLLRRLLKASGVTFVRSGRTVLVPLSEIEEKLPTLWNSFRSLERARTTAGEGSSTGSRSTPRR